MRVSYTDGYFVELPEKHPFPMGKFPSLHSILVREQLVVANEVHEPGEAAWADLERVHTTDYLSKLEAGLLGPTAVRKLGLPWSPALVRRSRLAVQGTLMAARMALEDGIAANLAGGTHHAFPGHGEGFCVLNDVATAICVLRAEQRIGSALVIDLDVHQGNGTAAVFAGDPSVYTFSMHGRRNYPFTKEASSLDVELPDGMTDDAYLAELRRHLPQVVAAAAADVVFYLAGVDPMAGDRYGRLALTRQGLHRRDRAVLEAIAGEQLPLVLLMSGGYAPTPEATADLHAIAHREARRFYA